MGLRAGIDSPLKQPARLTLPAIDIDNARGRQPLAFSSENQPETISRRSALSRLLLLEALVELSSAGIVLTGCGSPQPCGSNLTSLTRHANPIIAENELAGDSSWRLSNAAQNHEIEGYASAVSAAPGEEIRLFVSTADSRYTLEVFRMGWYGGSGARRMTPAIERAGRRQLTPFPDPATSMVECQWTDPYVVKIPAGAESAWLSGIYLVKLTGADSGKQSYIVFVVRDDASRSDLLFQSSVNTYQAYNAWGGASLYTRNPRAYKVSFNRPYERGHGAGDFLQWEYNMVRFLEREGYDVTYSTDVDTHARGDLLTRHLGFLVVGHDEYWSWEMRSHVESARDAGVGLGFLGANTCFWQIRYEPSPVTAGANRTIVGYKEFARQKDPYAASADPDQLQRTTTMWRRKPVSRPEDELVGVMYDWDLGSPDTDIVVVNTFHPLFKGSGLNDGDRLPGLLGYEADRRFTHAPSGTFRIGHSPVFSPTKHKTMYADMAAYKTSSCSMVVATGTLRWSWGLDDYAPKHPARSNPAVQQITRNILKQFGALPGLPG